MSDFTGDIEADFERISAAMETTNSDDPNFDTLLVASQTVAAAVYESRHRQVQEDAQLAEEWTHRCTLGDSQVLSTICLLLMSLTLFSSAGRGA